MASRMSVSLSPRHKTTILPSLPPSPSLLDEIFSHRQSWNIRLEQFDTQSSRPSSSGSAGSLPKGKGKQPSEGGDDQQCAGAHEAYPPTTDEAAETRRVEETLRRWELADRKRRKSLRESVQHPPGSSLLSSVKQTATLVFLRRSGSTSASVGQGNTRAFKSQGTVDVAREGYAVPPDDIDTPGNTTLRSPSPSVFDRDTSLDAGTRSVSRTSENPFVHPEDTPTRLLTPVAPTPTLPPSTPPSPSPFSDARGLRADLLSRVGKRSSGSGESFIQAPTGPDDFASPLVHKPRMMPPQPISQPVLRPPRHQESEEKEEVRWWHDWLCGCGEGPDRGGDNQAGRTNPFE